MALGTGSQRLVSLLTDNWQASRTGRADIPAVITGDPRTNSGVLIRRDREDVYKDNAKHDLVHCYHPEGNPPTTNDNGYSEVQELEWVQIDISLTDRTDHSLAPADQRLSAKERMVGLRGDLADVSQPPYGGIAGEVYYHLETVRRGLSEWEKVSTDMVNWYLGNSNANVSFMVELEIMARSTVV